MKGLEVVQNAMRPLKGGAADFLARSATPPHSFTAAALAKDESLFFGPDTPSEKTNPNPNTTRLQAAQGHRCDIYLRMFSFKFDGVATLPQGKLRHHFMLTIWPGWFWGTNYRVETWTVRRALYWTHAPRHFQGPLALEFPNPAEIEDEQPHAAQLGPLPSPRQFILPEVVPEPVQNQAETHNEVPLPPPPLPTDGSDVPWFDSENPWRDARDYGGDSLSSSASSDYIFPQVLQTHQQIFLEGDHNEATLNNAINNVEDQAFLYAQYFRSHPASPAAFTS